MFRFKPASQYVEEQCHSMMSCALAMEELISKFLVNSGNKKDMSNVF
jgi:hypothetical protein